MELKNILEENKKVIREKWALAVIETYEAYAVKFLRRTNNQFKNPVGHTIEKGIGELFDYLINDSGSNELPPTVIDLVKIRAVQDMPPSKAVSFIFIIKKIINELFVTNEHNGLIEQIEAFEASIDQTALAIFDVYMDAKQKLFDIKIREIKSGMFYQFENLQGNRDKPEGLPNQ